MYKMDYQLENFITQCEVRQLRPKTIKSYEGTLRIFSKYLYEDFKITSAEDVQEKHIMQYVNHLKERGKYTVLCDKNSELYNHPQKRPDYGMNISITTINNYLRNMRVFFNYLYSEHEIKKNPMGKVILLKDDRKPLEFISDENFMRLLRCLDRSKFSENRDWTIIQLLIDTGMRIGECLLIKVSDADLTRKSIYITLQNTKGGKTRSVFFSEEMNRILKMWLRFQDRYRNTEYLFCTNEGKHLQISNFETNFKKYGKRIGLNTIHPHVLRNNFAKRFLMNGGNIFTLSKILGHSSVEVTEKAYLDLDDDDLRQTYQNFSPLSNMKKY